MIKDQEFYLNIINNSEDFDKKLYAVKKLRDFKTEEVVDVLVEFLENDEPMARYIAAQSLGEIANKKAVKSLLEALVEPESWVKIQIIEALGKIKPENITQILIKYLETETDNKVKATIIKIFGVLNDESVIPFLAEYLNSNDKRIKANTIEALENFDIDKIQPLLEPFKSDSNNRVRANTALLYLKHGNREGIDILKHMLNEHDEWMVASAVYALGEIGTQECYDILKEHKTDKKNLWSIRKNLIIAYAKMINKDVKDAEKAFEKILNSENPEEVLYCVEIIGVYRLRKFIPSITQKLKTAKGDLREKIEEALDTVLDYE